MENPVLQQQKPTRKLRDSWALGLFAVSTVSVNAMLALQNHSKIANFVVLYRACASAAAFVACFVLATLVAFRFFPKVILHAAFIASILMMLMMTVLGGGVLFAIIGVLGTAMAIYSYVYLGLKFIPFTAAVLRGATSIVIGNLFAVLCAHVFSIVMFTAQLGAAFSTLKISRDYFVHAFVIFQVFWLQANAMYFFIVFVSSITAIHIFNVGRPMSIFAESLKNTFFALGSICLGGLLLAVVQTLRYMIYFSESESRRRNENERSAFVRILAFIAEILLIFLEDLIRLANDWVFVQIAVYGKSYKKALEESFEKAINPANHTLINALIVDMAVFFVGIFGIGSFLLLLETFVGMRGNRDAYVEMALPVILVIFSVTTFLSVFSAGSKTVLFAHAEKPECVAAVLPDVSAAIIKLNSEIK